MTGYVQNESSLVAIARGVGGGLPHPLVPWHASTAAHEAQLGSVHLLATHVGGSLALDLAAPEGSGVPVIAPVTNSHLLSGLAAGTAITVGSHHGEEGEQDDDEGCGREGLVLDRSQ